MHVYLHSRECIQYHPAQLAVDLHRSHGILFSASPGLYLECLGPIGIHFLHIGYNILGKLLESPVFHTHDRADSHDSEYSLQALYRLFIVILAFTFHIDPALGFVNIEFSVYPF